MVRCQDYCDIVKTDTDSMKLGRRRETVLGMFTVVLLLGMMQFIVYIHPKSNLSTMNSQKKSELRNRLRETTFHHKDVHVADTGHWAASVHVSGDTSAGRNADVKSKAVVEPEKKVGLTPPLRLSPHLYIPPAYDPLIFGRRRYKQGFLTIGIPSIRRPNTDVIYLFDTIQSIINTTSPDQRTDITVVILLSDHNETYNDEIAGDIYVTFKPYCDEGFIQVINPPEVIYPDFRQLKRTKHDTLERVKWRAKQNIDFSYLFLYSVNISHYYIQLEDDLICAKNFSTYIRQQINRVTTDWAMLEFSRLGFIGKLFKNNDLPQIANLLLLDFDTKPGDLLLGKILNLRDQKMPIYTNFSLFQHNGKFSSLLNKMMPSIDINFKDFGNQEPSIRHLPEGSYPSATIVTTFDIVRGYPPSNAYDGNSTTFFWAKKLQRTEYFSLTFENAQNFSRILISTGDPYVKKDSLMSAYLYVRVKRSGDHPRHTTCDRANKMAPFVDGELDTKAMGTFIPRDIMCIRIQPLKNSKTWVIFREIVLIP